MCNEYTFLNLKALTLLMVSKQRQNTCMRKGSEFKTRDSNNYVCQRNINEFYFYTFLVLI